MGKKPLLTSSDKKHHRSQKNCEICRIKFTKSSEKHAHHRWDATPVYENCKLIKGNYIAALCNRCNWRISITGKELPVFGHNGAKFDSKFIIRNLNADRYNVDSIIAKGGENFISLKIRENISNQNNNIDISNPNTNLRNHFMLNFKDSFMFMNESLDNLSNSLRESGHIFKMLRKVLKDEGYSDEVVKMSNTKGIFPYEYIDSVKKLDETELPDISKFFSSLKQTNITEIEYKSALEMFSAAKCSNIKDYLKLYLIIDILLLAEVFTEY